jgi:hypothetical protein
MVWISSSIKRFDFMRAGVADDDQADVIADERGQFLVLQDCRGGLEQFGLFRIVDVRFDFVAALGAQVAHQRVEDAQGVEILAFLGNLVLEGFAQRRDRVLDGLDRVCHDEAADRGAADDDQLERLVEHLDVPAHRHESTKHAANGDDKPDNDIHDASPQ